MRTAELEKQIASVEQLLAKLEGTAEGWLLIPVRTAPMLPSEVAAPWLYEAGLPDSVEVYVQPSRTPSMVPVLQFSPGGLVELPEGWQLVEAELYLPSEGRVWQPGWIHDDITRRFKAWLDNRAKSSH